MKLIIIAIALSLAGCSTVEYSKYSDSQVAIQVAKSNAEAEKYKAMAVIAQSGDTTAKVAAMFAMHSGLSQQQQPTIMQAPKSGWDSAREWMGILLPTAVQAYGINANQRIATTQSNNARDVAVSTNQTFATMGTTIGSSAALAGDNITIGAGGVNGAGIALSGTGTTGSGNFASNDGTSLSGTGTTGAGGYQTAVPTIVNANPTPLPGQVCAVSGAGVVTCN